MVGDFFIGNLMGIKYKSKRLGVVIRAEDVEGDFMGSLSEREKEWFGRWLEASMDCFIEYIKAHRQRKESHNGLEGQNEGMGRG